MSASFCTTGKPNPSSLRPCPFCGGAAGVLDAAPGAQPGNRFRFRAMCMSRRNHQAKAWGASLAAAVRAWNGRAGEKGGSK